MFTIGNRKIGPCEPVYIIAELSANHHQSLEEALSLIDLAKEAGADAVKIQTYTADTMTLDSTEPPFIIGAGTIWEGRKLHDLYQEAHTPWEWTPDLIKRATDCGLDFLSTPFDRSAVEFLDDCGLEAYKIASFELTDLPLLRVVGATGKPVILSTGMGSLREISEAVETLRESGCTHLALLKCTSSYPAPPDEANLGRISHMAEAFGVPVGLSDHTMGGVVPALAVALGAVIVEKHFTRSRSVAGPDSSFSLEPHEFAEMVQQVRIAEKAVGAVTYSLTSKEIASQVFRRSVFVVKDIEKDEILTEENIRVIRPAHGLPPRDYNQVLGRRARVPLSRGTPLSWEAIR